MKKGNHSLESCFNPTNNQDENILVDPVEDDDAKHITITISAKYKNGVVESSDITGNLDIDEGNMNVHLCNNNLISDCLLFEVTSFNHNIISAQNLSQYISIFIKA